MLTKQCCNHFTMCVNEVIMLHTLNLYGIVFQLYLNKTERRKDSVFPCKNEIIPIIE